MDSVQAVVDHCGNRIEATVVASPKDAAKLAGSFTAEMSYEAVEKAECGLSRKDEASGVFCTEVDGLVLVDGTVSTILSLEDDGDLIDLYLMNGPEFLAVSSAELGQSPPLDSRVRVWVRGLRIYPVSS